MDIQRWGTSEWGFLLFLLLALCASIFWLRALLDCVTKESNDGNTKAVWVIIIIFTNLVGAVAYWLVRRPRRYAELGR
jgi:Phospholipase_D-nuclease N-terminal